MSEVIERRDTAVTAATAKDATSIMSVIAAAATNPQCDVEKMQALLAMQTQLRDREDRAEFNSAMIAASGEIPQIERLGRASMGQKGSYMFARWEDMDRAIRPILTAHGLRLSFTTNRLEDGSVVVIGTASHLNGQSQSAEFTLPADRGPGRNEAQSFGSALSYGKRYCAEMLFNIVRRDEDIDGKTPQPRTAPNRITADQKEELVRLLSDTGTDVQKFLSWARCPNLDEMEARNFPKARQALQAKLSEGAAQ